MDKAAGESKQIPPYVPWKTFTGFVERLKETAIPTRIDHTIMGNLSGITRNQLRAGLMFFGLVQADGTVTERFAGLIAAFGTPNWRRLLHEIIREAYAPVIDEEEVAITTTGHLAERIRAGYGIEGDTAKKVMRFYLNALKDSGGTISPHVKLRERRSVGVRRKRASNGRSGRRGKDERIMPDEETEMPPPGMICIPFALRGKPTVKLVVPEDLSRGDWAMIDLYVKGFFGFAE